MVTGSPVGSVRGRSGLGLDVRHDRIGVTVTVTVAEAEAVLALQPGDGLYVLFDPVGANQFEPVIEPTCHRRRNHRRARIRRGGAGPDSVWSRP